MDVAGAEVANVLTAAGLIRGKRIVGSWGGDTKPDRDIPRYARLFQDGKLPLTALISREYPLEDVNAALEDLPLRIDAVISLQLICAPAMFVHISPEKIVFFHQSGAFKFN